MITKFLSYVGSAEEFIILCIIGSASYIALTIASAFHLWGCTFSAAESAAFSGGLATLIGATGIGIKLKNNGN